MSVETIAPAVPARTDEHLAAVYLARLAPSGPRTMRAALDTIAGMVTGGAADAAALPWHELRYPHTQAIRTALAERYAPATANKHLSTLRGVLREAWWLRLMSAEDSARACDLAPCAARRCLRGGRCPRGSWRPCSPRARTTRPAVRAALRISRCSTPAACAGPSPSPST